MRLFKKSTLFIALVTVLQSYGYNNDTFDVSSGDIEPGVWNSNYIAGMQYAEKYNVPAIMVSSSASILCDYCNELKKSFISDGFKAWAQERQYVLLFAASAELEQMTMESHQDFVTNSLARALWPDSDPDDVLQTFYGNASRSLQYPTACVYWPRSSSSRFLSNFVARKSSIDAEGSSLAEKFINKIDSLIAEAYTGGDFKRGLDLQSEAGAANTVWVPFERNGAVTNSTAVNTVTVRYPDGESVSETIDWAKGRSEAFVQVNVREGLAAGDKIIISVIDGDAVRSTADLTIVAPKANSSVNPYWIGEKTVDELGFGEWTMDLDVATNKVAQTIAAGGDAYTLVMSAGPLWCPDCFGFEEDVLDKSAFTDWAKANNVALVLIDQPRWQKPGPSLLTWDYGNEERDKATGSEYLSRKGISPEAAEEVIARNTYLSQTLWLAPETSSVRLANPNVLLVSPEGEVLCRMYMQEDSDRRYDLDENLKRLDELLLLTSEKDNYASTTPLSLPVNVVSNLTMQINDRVAFYALEGATPGKLALDVSGDIGTAGPKATLWAKKDSALTEVLPGSDGKYAVDLALLENELFVKVEVYADVAGDEVIFSDTFTSSVTAVDVKAELELIPGEIAFTETEVSCLEISGKGSVGVVRKNGNSGRAEVSVVTAKYNVTDGRCEWVDTTIVWQDGEDGLKTIDFKLNSDTVFSGPENFVLKLSPATDCPAAVSEEKLTVTVLDSEDPSFSKLEYSIGTYEKFAGEDLFEVFNIGERGSVSLRKVSGKLPSGLKLKYDKETGNVVLSGSPKKPGVYTVEYAIRQNGKTGLPATFTITVDDPAQYNAYVGEKINQDVPLYAETGSGKLVLAGRLNVAVSSSNKIKAKYYGTEKKTVSFSGEWNDFDPVTGEASASIVTKKEESLDLKLTRDGILEVVRLAGVENAFGEEFSGEKAVSEESGFESYAGYYNVSLPAVVADGETVDSAGSGYLTLTLTSKSSIRSGKMKYSGVLGNGTSVSGYAYLEIDPEDPDTAYLPIFVRKSKDLFSAVLQIKSGAADKPFSINDLQSVHTAEGVAAMHRYSGSYGFGYEVECEAYGSYYEKNTYLNEWCDIFALDPESVTLSFNGTKVSSQGSSYGAVTFGSDAQLTADRTKFKILNPKETFLKRISFSRSGGTFSGSAKMKFASGKSVTGTIKGVLTPGWFEDCGCGDIPDDPLVERPFASGTIYYSDKVSVVENGRERKVTVKRSAPVSIRVDEVPQEDGE